MRGTHVSLLFGHSENIVLIPSGDSVVSYGGVLCWIIYPIVAYIFNKFGVSESRHLQSQNQQRQERKRHKSRRSRGTNKYHPGIAESLGAAARVRTRCNIVHPNDRKAAQSGIGDFEGLLTSKQ